MNETVEERVALVTGAASGIGRASALAFAGVGARVVVADVDEDGGRETVRLIEEAGGAALWAQTDVSDAAAVDAAVAAALERWGRLDWAHNNAGVETPPVSLAEMSEADFDRLVAINLKGVWLSMRAELRPMIAQGAGVIVNTSSVVGLVGSAGMPAYVATKHGITGLTKAGALDHAAQGVRVNAVCPGVIKTPMLDRYTHGDPALEAELGARQPIGRIGTPEDVAQAVVWLCSPAAAFVTGHTLAVDGGYVAQ